jgi:polysaccharide biosynthesis protein VpsM
MPCKRYLWTAVLLGCWCIVVANDPAGAQQDSFPLRSGDPFTFGLPYNVGGPPRIFDPSGMSRLSETMKAGQAEGGIRLGPFRAGAGLQVTQSFTDNANLTDKNKESDFTTSLQPSFTLTAGQGVKYKDYVSFGYDGDLGAYTRVTDNSYTRHTLWADVNLLQRPTFYMRFRQAFTYTDDPYGNDEYFGQGASTPRILNQADFVVGRRLPNDYAIELHYQNALENYQEDLDQERSNITHTIGTTLLYELSGKTKLLAEYSYSYRDFYDQSSIFSDNYTVQQVMAGFRWAATARLSGEFKAGYAWRIFKDRGGELGFLHKDDSTPIYSGNLHYMVSPKTALDLDLDREFLLGSDFFPGTETVTSLQEGYVRNLVGLRASTSPRENLTFTAGAAYSIEQYGDTLLYGNRIDHFINAGIGFQHRIRRYLGYGLNYSYQNRDTDVESESYQANVVSASLFISF